MKHLVISILTLLGTQISHAAWQDITPSGSKENTVYIRLSDVIHPGDTERLKVILEKRNASPGKTTLWMQMHSRGGDVSESYKIRRLLQSHR